jgi:hypothetical protein
MHVYVFLSHENLNRMFIYSKVVSTELIKMVNADVAKSQPFNYYFFLKKKKKKSKLGFKEFYVIEYFENSKGS